MDARTGRHPIDILWAMEVFVRAADTGGFSRAAEALDVSSTTVTTTVRNLERHLGVTLIDRDTRRFHLTEAGRVYLARAREVVESAARAADEVQAQAGQLRGRVNVETTIALGRTLISPRLPSFAQRHPDITIALTLGNQIRSLIEHSIDVAIRLGNVDDPDVVARPLRVIRYVLCCAPALATTLPAHPRDIDPRTCIGNLAEGRYTIRPWRLQRAGEVVEIRPAGPLHFNNGADQALAAAAGAGIACVFDVLAEPALRDRSLVRVYPDWTIGERTLYLVIPRSRVGSAKVKAFTDFLVETLGEARP